MKERKKVLIIDTEVDVPLLLKTYFLRKGYLVDIAHDVISALQFVRGQPPHYIFLSAAACQNLDEDTQKLKATFPDADIRINEYPSPGGDV